TLTVIQDSLEAIKRNHGVDIDIDNIDNEDPEVLEIFKNAETIGIFQFESAGMRRFLKELKADRFENLVAANSLFRPGPMDQIPQFVASKHDSSKISYIHPQLEEILEPTYGCIVYQEQVMQIVRKIGGYSFGHADLIRRAMSKKKMDEMERERRIFIYGKEDSDGNVLVTGAVRNGVDEISANRIFDLMIDFANYAFNKSHSVAYAVVAFQTAYLKRYYPSEYMAALISSIVSQTNQVVLYLEECKRLGIEILRPDVNKSFKKFSVENDAIRFGLLGIKGIGGSVIEAIVGARELDGDFTSLKDFITRVSDFKANALNKRALDGLIRSGSLDGIIPSRAKAMCVYEDMLSSHLQEQKRNLQGQFDLFGGVSEYSNSYDLIYPNVPEFSNTELYEMEKESTGVYITGHPLEEYEETINRINTYSIGEIKIHDETEDHIFYDGKVMKLAGMIINIRRLLTRKNDLMAFITIEDLVDSIECVVFPRTFEQYLEYIEEDKVVTVIGKLQVSDAEETKLIVERITPIEEEMKRNNSRKLFLRMDSKDDTNTINEIINVLSAFKGNTDVVFYFSNEKLTTTNEKIKIDVARIEDITTSLSQHLEENDIVLK
ncbi:MAG: DNA polymerase III subunit alpha, partial [Tissierellia bacterium]|nr:DNA polymerase III subunit alpha [Tissierellia bacterium]